MNDTIRLLMDHRSIRQFTAQPVSQEQLQTIVSAAQWASSSSNVQAYSVIHVTDPEARTRISEWAGNQAHVAVSPIFLVWCADLYRLRAAYELHENPKTAYLGTTENWLVASIDVALAAQNAAIAAESMGLGVVYIGGIRNKIAQVAKLLQLPQFTSPLFGMCIGYPDQQPGQRPRLPQQAVLHENTYRTDELTALIRKYDETMQAYMLNRTGGKRGHTWSEDMTKKLSAPARMQIKAFLEAQGLARE